MARIRGIILCIFYIFMISQICFALQDYNKDRVLDVKDLVLEKNPRLIQGDVNSDSEVDVFDLSAVGKNYNEKEFSNNTDLNSDGKIDEQDLNLIEKNFGGIKENSESNTKVFFEESVQVYRQENFISHINISTNAKVFASAIRISFNSSVLYANSISEGEFLKKDSAEIFCTTPLINNSAGYIDVGCTRIGVQTGISGEGVLFEINFSAIEKGNTTLRYEDLQIVDENIQEISDVEKINGFVEIIVNKINSQTSLTFDKKSPQIYGESIKAICKVLIGDGEAILKRNGVNVDENNKNIILAAGNYNYNCIMSETESYKSSENSSIFIVNKKSPVLNFYLNWQKNNLTLVYPTPINISATEIKDCDFYATQIGSFSASNVESVMVIGNEIKKISVKKDARGLEIIAGLDLGEDKKYGTSDDKWVESVAKIGKVSLKNAYDCVISAGVSSLDYVWGNDDER